MEAQIVDNRDANRFEIMVDGERVGFLAYELASDTMSLTEIETDVRMVGKGLGLTLVRGALDAASGAALSVRPVCAFVRDYIERHPVYLDLVPQAERTEYGLPEAA
jgi:predicted GNAT family acetyltransferase